LIILNKRCQLIFHSVHARHRGRWFAIQLHRKSYAILVFCCSDMVHPIVWGCEEYRVCSVLTQHWQLFRVLKHTDSTLCSDMVLTMAWSTNSMFWSVMVLTTVKSSEEHREYVVFWHSTYNGLELWTVQTVCCVLNYGTSTVFVHHDWNEEVSWELKQTATGKRIVDFQDPPI